MKYLRALVLVLITPFFLPALVFGYIIVIKNQSFKDLISMLKEFYTNES